MTQFEKVTAKDTKTLARVSTRAFNSDIDYGAPGTGGPPGYNNDIGQMRLMMASEYYKILKDGVIIGGIAVRPVVYQHYELIRIFVDPDYQRQGIGSQAIAFVESQHPEAKKWTLGTPKWNTRTPQFYESCGYVKVGTNRSGLLYEKAREL